jgi:hypothetical protein
MNNGLLDSAFRDPRDSRSSTDAQIAGTDTGGTYTIRGLYVTNDATHLYVALDFGAAPPGGYKKSRINIIVDNPDVNGSATLFTGNAIATREPVDGGARMSTTVNPANPSNGINQYVTKQLDSGNLSSHPTAGPPSSNASWAWYEFSGDWQCYPIQRSGDEEPDAAKIMTDAFRVIKFRIPRATLGMNGSVRVFAAFSEGHDNWPDPHLAYVRGFIPKAAAIPSRTMPDPGGTGMMDTIVVNMADALLYPMFN